MRRSRPSIALATLLSLGLLVGACGGDDDDSGGGSGAGGSGASGGSGSGGDLETVAGALAAVPAGGSGGSGGEHQTVLWGDLGRAAAIADVTVPEDHTDADAVADYFQILTNGRVDADTASPVLVLPPAEAGAARVAQIEEFTDEMGWNLLDVARFVERQTLPDMLTVLEGAFDEGALTEAMGEPVSDGLWAAGDPEAEDFSQDLNDRTAARPLGQTLWMDLDGERMALARRRATAEAAAGAGSGGDAATLADDEVYAALAGGLDSAEVYGAMLVSPGLTAGPRQLTPEQATAVCDGALPAPTAGVATGIAEDDGAVYVLTLAHDSPEAAEANAAAVEEIVAEGESLVSRERWSDMVTLDGVDVTDGSVVVARLRPVETGPPALWYQLVMERDGLVSHC